MISASHRTGSPARTDDTLVVRYRDQYPGFYMARIFPLFVVLAILASLYLDDDMRRLIFSRNTANDKPFSWLEFGFLLALAAAPLLDLAITLTRVRRGTLALSVSPEGITGSVLHMTRLLTWHEIEDVAVSGKFLVVRRRPRSLLQHLLAGRGLGDIHVPARHLDREAEDILTAVHHFKSAQYYRPAAS
jgi:hypothetical protein